MTTKYYIETVDGKLAGILEFTEDKADNVEYLKEMFYECFMKDLNRYDDEMLHYCIKHDLPFQYIDNTIAVRILDLIKNGINITAVPMAEESPKVQVL